MSTFDVSLSKRVYLNLKIEADSAEEANKIAQARHRSGELAREQWVPHTEGETAEEFSIDWTEEGQPKQKNMFGMDP